MQSHVVGVAFVPGWQECLYPGITVTGCRLEEA